MRARQVLWHGAIGRTGEETSLVSRVKRVVQVDAGQDRKHIGLQAGDQEFEGVERHAHGESQRCDDDIGAAQRCQRHRETGE